MRKLLLICVATFLQLLSFAQDTAHFKASFYHKKFEGRKTANGDVYREDSMTAASNYYKLGTKVLVINLKTGERVVVRINDRTHAKMKSRIDLSKAAFKKIAEVKKGVISVKTTEL